MHKTFLLEISFLIPGDECSLNLLLKLMEAAVVRPLAELEGGHKV